MLTDVEREEALRIFSELYAQTDFDMMVIHMPRSINDVDGDLFSEYFDFLQSLYLLRDNVKEYENENQLDVKIRMLKKEASKFSYPTNILEVFDVE